MDEHGPRRPPRALAAGSWLLRFASLLVVLNLVALATMSARDDGGRTALTMSTQGVGNPTGAGSLPLPTAATSSFPATTTSPPAAPESSDPEPGDTDDTTTTSPNTNAATSATPTTASPDEVPNTAPSGTPPPTNGVPEPTVPNDDESTVEAPGTAAMVGWVADGRPGHCVVGRSDVAGSTPRQTETNAEGNFRLGGFRPGEVVHLVVSAECADDVGGEVRRSISLGGPGSTTNAGTIRADGDTLGSHPTLSGSLAAVDTYLATRSGDDPIPSCAPGATGGTVWRDLSGASSTVTTDRPVVVAVFTDGLGGVLQPLGSSGMAEVDCWLVDGDANLPTTAGELLMVQGLSGPTDTTFSPVAP